MLLSTRKKSTDLASIKLPYCCIPDLPSESVENFVNPSKITSKSVNFTTILLATCVIKSKTCTLVKGTNLLNTWIYLTFDKPCSVKQGQVLLVRYESWPLKDSKKTPLALFNPDIRFLGSCHDFAACVSCKSYIVHTVNTLKCPRCEKRGVEMARRSRAFLSGSRAVQDDSLESIEWNATYSLMNGKFINVSVNSAEIRRGTLSKRFKPDGAQDEEDPKEKRMRDFLARKNDNGGKQMRAVRGIEKEKVDTSGALSTEALRAIGFNPYTRQDFVYEDMGKKEERQKRIGSKDVEEGEKIELIYFTDEED